MEHRHTKGNTPEPMDALHTQLMDQALTRGLAFMGRTYGLRVEPVGYNVLPVALQRAIEMFPRHATADDMLATISRLNITVGCNDVA
jgi:hypothetical protein